MSTPRMDPQRDPWHEPINDALQAEVARWDALPTMEKAVRPGLTLAELLATIAAPDTRVSRIRAAWVVRHLGWVPRRTSRNGLPVKLYEP